MNITITQNTTNFAPSPYSNFFFSRGIISIGGKNIALSCNALCSLGGDADDVAPISSFFQTGSIAFNDGEKRVRSLHIKGQFESKNSLLVKYGMDTFSPDLTTDEAMTSKVGSGGGGSLKFQGVRSKHGEHLCVRVENVNGEKFYVRGITGIIIRGSRK